MGLHHHAPLFKHLEMAKRLEGKQSAGGIGLRFSPPPHPNPEFYKTTWWIFHLASPVEGKAFMTDEHALCTADAMQLVAKLREQGEPYLVYNKSQPRLPKHGTPPWDINAKRWEGCTWAPNWHDDQDPEWQGHK